MERPILLDTDILIDFFRGFDKAVAFVNNYYNRIILSSIVVAELYVGVKGDACGTKCFTAFYITIPFPSIL